MKAKRSFLSLVAISWFFLLTIAVSFPVHADIGTDWLVAQRLLEGAYTRALPGE